MHISTVPNLFSIKSTSTRSAPCCFKGIQFTILTGFMFLSFLSTSIAADLSDSLKGVTITNAIGTNKPPKAVFTYTQNGETFTFDAGGSSDPDGSITNYKWTFGDETASEGATATYSLAGTASLQVTLTVIDNNGGIALSQQTITSAPIGILDDFSTDSSANFTRLFGAGTLEITEGYAHLATTWSNRCAFYHNSSIGSPNQYIEYSASLVDSSNQAGAVFRVNPINLTAYVSYFTENRLAIRGIDLSTGSWTGNEVYSDNTYAAGNHTVAIYISGEDIVATVDGTASITTKQTIYNTGNYAGIVFYRSAGDPKMYNFKARSN